jgi:single-strand DNA-binding protein
MRGLNQFVLVGAVAEVRFIEKTDDTKPRSYFLVAGVDDVFDAAGKVHAIPWYHHVSFFGTRAEFLKNVKKGQVVRVAGKLSYSEWTDNTGRPRTGVSLIGSKLDTLLSEVYQISNDSKGNPRLNHARNEVQLGGNTIVKPEVRVEPNGYTRSEYTLGVYEFYTDAGGTKQESQTIVPISAWGTQATISAKLLKGAGAYITGRLKNEKDPDLGTRMIVEALDIQLVASRHTEAKQPPNVSRLPSSVVAQDYDHDDLMVHA